MNIQDKIQQQSDKLHALTHEKSGTNATLAVNACVLAAVAMTAVGMSSMIPGNPLGLNTLTSEILVTAGLGTSFVGYAIDRMFSSAKDLLKPITGQVNNISNEKLYQNFMDMHYKAKYPSEHAAVLVENVVNNASEDKFESLQEFLNDKGTTEAIEFSKQLWSNYDKKLVGEFKETAAMLEAKQTPIGEKVAQSSTRLQELLQRTGIANVTSLAYSKAVSDAREQTSPVEPKQITQSFIIDTVRNENLYFDWANVRENTSAGSALESRVSALKDELSEDEFIQMVQDIHDINQPKPVAAKVAEFAPAAKERIEPSLGELKFI